MSFGSSRVPKAWPTPGKRGAGTFACRADTYVGACSRERTKTSVGTSALTTGNHVWVTLLATGSDRRVTLSEDKVSHSAAPVVNKACPMCCDSPARMSARATCNKDLLSEGFHAEVLSRVLAKSAQKLFHASQGTVQGFIELRIGQQSAASSLAR